MPIFTLTPPKPPPLTLLSLPPELRSLIFTFALSLPHSPSSPTASINERITFLPDILQRQYYTVATQPALTRVSRQIRAESLPLYYESSTFVLHTEPGEKLEDARRWLMRNEAWLGEVRRLTLWVRYVPGRREPGGTMGARSGAIAVVLRRRKGEWRWRVGGEEGRGGEEEDWWRWITVTRKPVGIAGDVEILRTVLGDQALLRSEAAVCGAEARPEDYMRLMDEFRIGYAQKKVAVQ